MNNTKEALTWITDILKKLEIPFQITGGLAAKAYGSARELADIDIDIPEEDLEKIKIEVESFITFGPAHHKSEGWDLMLMTLNYKDQTIDLSGAHSTKIFNKKNGTWVKLETDFSKVNYLDIYGVKIPVICRNELIAYKKILSRPVDLIDVENLEKKPPRA